MIKLYMSYSLYAAMELNSIHETQETTSPAIIASEDIFPASIPGPGQATSK